MKMLKNYLKVANYRKKIRWIDTTILINFLNVPAEIFFFRKKFFFLNILTLISNKNCWRTWGSRTFCRIAKKKITKKQISIINIIFFYSSSKIFLKNPISYQKPIFQLTNLTMLDISNNKLRSLPTELGDMISLCHLYLNNNQLRVLPYELGKLFRIQTLGLQGNPLSPEISKIYHETNGAQKILQFLLDHLTSKFTFLLFAVKK